MANNTREVGLIDTGWWQGTKGYQGVVVVDIIDRDKVEESPTMEDSEILTGEIKKKEESVGNTRGGFERDKKVVFR